jgi:hypothetical protein
MCFLCSSRLVQKHDASEAGDLQAGCSVLDMETETHRIASFDNIA